MFAIADAVSEYDGWSVEKNRNTFAAFSVLKY